MSRMPSFLIFVSFGFGLGLKYLCYLTILDIVFKSK